MKQATDTARWAEVAEKIGSLQRKADELLTSLQALFVSIPTPGAEPSGAAKSAMGRPLEPGAEVSA